MSPLRLNGSTSGFSQLDAPAIAGDQTFTLPGTGGTIDRLNRAGNILQVVNANTSTGVTSSSGTFADTGLTASIAPTSTTSKILVLVNQAGCGKTTTAYMQIRLLRDATQLFIYEGNVGWTNTLSMPELNVGSCSICYLDSPATISSTTYKTQFNSPFNVSTTFVNRGSTSTITLMEIAA